MSNAFVHGAIMLGFIVATMFFYKFWRKTRDRLFLYFSIAFILMSMNRIAFLITGEESELRTYVYVVRLIAFLLIIIAIAEKNFAESKQVSEKQEPADRKFP